MNAAAVHSCTLDPCWPKRTCKTIQEYLQAAYGLLDHAGHAHAFRGVGTHYCNLWPSFDRRIIKEAEPVDVETRILEEFIERAWNYLTPQERHRYLLAEKRWGSKRNTGTVVVARHRLVPTRCVDWTDCPLRALFFACEDLSKCSCDGEVWWFNRPQFERCLRAQWPTMYRKYGHVEADIEKDFIAKRDRSWFTTLYYKLIADDRLDRQNAWITIAGSFGKCHAQEINGLGVSKKGRLVISGALKHDAIRQLAELGITRESLGLCSGDPADEIGKQIKQEFERRFDKKTCQGT